MTEDIYSKAREIVIESRKASTSYLQRTMKIGYNEAARLMERMEADGLVSLPNAAGVRQVLAGAPPSEFPPAPAIDNIREIPNLERNETAAAFAQFARMLPELAANAATIARARRDLFNAYLAAGFTEPQALELCRSIP